MHSMPRKALEIHLYLQECHLKQKVESEVEICLKVLLNFVSFEQCGMFCHISAADERSAKVNKFGSFYCNRDKVSRKIWFKYSGKERKTQ